MLLLAACTTTKSTSDISKWQRFYHNLTGQYNGYFNANEIIELSVQDMQIANQDNYTQLLPIFPYTGNYDAASYNENLDKAITKVTTTATVHEKGQWVDDSYVLMGKAQYLKKDYESAEETFEYFKEEFDFSRYHTGRQKSNARLSRGERAKERKKQQKRKKAEKKERDKEREEDAKERDAERKERDKTRKEELKERAKAKKKKSGSRERAAENIQWEDPALEKSTQEEKKEEEVKEEDKDKKEKEAEEKKEEKALKKSNRKHTPAFYEGLLWLAKTYSERERFASAEYLFNSIDDEDDAPKEVKKQIPLSRARMYLVKKDYDKTIESLDEAISLEKSKKLKARYSYIKAQIYTQMNEPGKALEAYEKVRKYNPDFVMEFNADLNKIILRNQTGSANTKSSLKALNRMLKEDKYATYQGQIYYAIGQINYQDGNIGDAIANYQNSLKFNSGNLFQKTESYYKLASLYFDTDDYAQAKYYYDSTLIFMPKTDYRFDQTTVYSNSLSSIAKNIEIIDTQDSLLAMGAMSSDEQRAYAIETLDNQGAKSDAVSTSRSINPTFTGSTGSIRMNASSFFAYNIISLQRGQKAFQNDWGGREIQDNWRTISDSDSAAAESDDLAVSNYSEQQIDAVLRTLPKTQAQRDLASMKKQEAMFELGKLYREKLKNPEAGFAMHKKLYQDNPDFKPQEELLYYLYLSGIDSNKRKGANAYKNKLIVQYPDSDFAKILTDPGYAQQLMEKEKAPIKYYDETYALFEKGAYKQVITRAAKAPDILQDDKALRAKMELINAISIGKEQGKAKYLMALNKVIKTYPNTEEERRATEMKRFLSGDEAAFNELLFEEDSDIFKEDFDKLHYGLVVIFDASSKVIQDMRLDINRFHKKYFSLEQLSTQTIPLSQEDNIKLILVRSFNDQSKAMDYFNVIDEKDKEFIKKKGYSFELFVINQNNYREIIKKRSINEYRIFFDSNYLNN